MTSVPEATPLLEEEITRQVREETLALVHSARLPRASEEAVIQALSGRTRVLPEGKASPFAALTFLSYWSAAGRASLRAVPAVVAMEMLMATGDLIDDVQDDEAELEWDLRSVGEALSTASILLLFCHSAVTRVIDRGVSPQRVIAALGDLGALSVDAIRGQTLDIDLEARRVVSIDEALNVSLLKSASLTSCAARMGAPLATDDESVIDLHARFGWHFGLMMQLANDVAAVWPGGRQKSDIRLRKKTVPIAFALALPGHRRHAALVQRYYEGDGARPDDLPSEDEVKWALWRCGAIHYAWTLAAIEKARAQRIAETLWRGAPEASPLGRLLE